MAATTGVFNSSDVGVYIDGVLVTCLVDATISISREFRDTTCKDSGIWRDILPSRISGNITASLLYKQDATEGMSELFADITNGTSVNVVFGKDNNDDVVYEASGYVNQWELSSPGSQENVTGNFAIEITGSLTETTLTGGIS